MPGWPRSVSGSTAKMPCSSCSGLCFTTRALGKCSLAPCLEHCEDIGQRLEHPWCQVKSIVALASSGTRETCEPSVHCIVDLPQKLCFTHPQLNNQPQGQQSTTLWLIDEKFQLACHMITVLQVIIPYKSFAQARTGQRTTRDNTKNRKRLGEAQGLSLSWEFYLVKTSHVCSALCSRFVLEIGHPIVLFKDLLPLKCGRRVWKKHKLSGKTTQRREGGIFFLRRSRWSRRLPHRQLVASPCTLKPELLLLFCNWGVGPT